MDLLGICTKWSNISDGVLRIHGMDLRNYALNHCTYETVSVCCIVVEMLKLTCVLTHAISGLNFHMNSIKAFLNSCPSGVAMFK